MHRGTDSPAEEIVEPDHRVGVLRRSFTVNPIGVHQRTDLLAFAVTETLGFDGDPPPSMRPST